MLARQAICPADPESTRISRSTKWCPHMSNPVPSEPSQISLKMTVRDQAQARELDMAWREIISGERLARTEVLENDIQSIMDRAQEALQIIETAIGNNPTSGQAGRLVRSLPAFYNGSTSPFVLTDLRVPDPGLANACPDSLNYIASAKGR